METATAGRDVRALATERLDQEARRFTRRTRAVMALEGVLALALGAAGVVSAWNADTATVVVAGFRLGLPQFAVLAGIGVLILATLRHPVALRRAAGISAVVGTVMFVAGGAYYPDGVWDVNVAGIFLPAVIALAGLAEAVFLSSADFVTAPSDTPDREPAGRAS
jgi:FtsH-binding integral membrane protein